MSHRKTLDMPPSKYLHLLAPSTHPPSTIPPHSQLPIHIKRLVRLDLHLPYAVARRDALLNRRLELIAPRTAPAIPIAVIIAAQKVALRLCAFLDRERDVDRLEQVFFERGVQGYDVVDVALDVLGVEAAQEVAGRVSRCNGGGRVWRGLQGAVYGVRHVVLDVRGGVGAVGGTVWVVLVVVGRQAMPLDVLWRRGSEARVMREL
jgi:hypothetical protein